MTPKTLTDREIVEIVSGLHPRKEDLREGDLIDRVQQFDRFELRRMPLSQLFLKEFALDEELVAEYAARIRAGESPPPIVLDSIAGSIIDGSHRANAALLAGETEIDVYAGVESTHTPTLHEDDDKDEFQP